MEEGKERDGGRKVGREGRKGGKGGIARLYQFFPVL